MTTQDRIRMFIVEELDWADGPGSLTPDFPLIDNHVIDSMGIMLLLAFLEEELGIRVPEEEVVPENFETLERITDFVEAARAR